MRFEIIEEPSGFFLVFDLETDMPAEIGGEPLFGLSHEEAEATAIAAEQLAGISSRREIRAV